MSVAIEKMEAFDTRACGDADVVSSLSGLHQQCRGAARPVPGNLALAAVRVPKINNGMGIWGRVSDQNPAVGARAGVAVADRASQRGRVARVLGQLSTPGEQEVVTRSVRFCKWYLHLIAMPIPDASSR